MSPLMLKTRPPLRETNDAQFVADCAACNLTPSTMLLSVSLPDGTPALALERAHDRFEVWPVGALHAATPSPEPRDEPTFAPHVGEAVPLDTSLDLPDSPATRRIAEALERQAAAMEAQTRAMTTMLDAAAPLVKKVVAEMLAEASRPRVVAMPPAPRPTRAKKSKKVAPNDA